MQLRVSLATAVLAAGLAAASATTPVIGMGRPGITPVPCPGQAWEFGDATFEALPGAKAFFGRYDGGLYRIEIPGNWNGELALYAHGYVANIGAQGARLRVGNSPIREHLLKNGYAWAASSYRCNGYVPGIGLQDTMALTDLFTKTNGGMAPRRVFLTGTSMGGHITLLGMQEFPETFAAGLAMCPAGPELFDFYTAVGAAAEVITGVQFKEGSVADDLKQMADVLGKPPDYTDKGRQLASVEIQISGGPRPFAIEGLASRFSANIDGVALAGGTSPANRAVTNARIKYAIDADLGLSADALNARARRKAADPDVRNPMGPYEEIVPFDGKIARPVMTLHGTGDLFVPISLEQALKQAVVAAGHQDLLVQRVMRIAGHCGFSQPEQTRAFDDLTAWVHDGRKPEGDEVLGDLSNAGLKFTNPLRANDPGHVRIPATTSPTSQPGTPIAKVDFVRDVQPIFRQNCYSCHGPAKQTNGFRLDRRSAAMRGSTVTPGVIRAGSSDASLLYFRVSGSLAGPQMPPTGALQPQQIATIKAWLDQGAEWPDAAAGEIALPPPDPKAARLMAAIRAGDARAVNALGAERRIGGLRGPGGSTPLMYAVLYGDVTVVRTLLDGGADPNLRNDAGATALMWAVHDLDKMRLLLDRGANVNVSSDDGRTPLLIAAGLPGGAPVVSMLLDRGADVMAKAPGLFDETTALVEAAYAGDEHVFRLLLDRGADPRVSGPVLLALAMRARCASCVDALLNVLPPQMITPAMLFAAPPLGPALGITLLLERGADVNAQDPAGHTILMLAAASDAIPTDAVSALISRGADVNAKTPAGETALTFARQRGTTAVVERLLKAGAAEVSATAAPPAKPVPAASLRAAIDRSLPLLQRTDTTFLKKSGCVSCHNNTLTAMTVAGARSRGIAVDIDVARRNLRTISTFVDGWRERVLQGIGIPGDADTISYILLGMAAEKAPASAATDAMARYLKRLQQPTGQWRILAHRPPIESSDVEVTAASMHALQVYAPKVGRASYDRAVQLAAGWLEKQTPTTTEEAAFKLLGLAWAHAEKSAVQTAAHALVAQQRPDGGWAQLASLDSDAYATGQALVAINESGAVAASDPTYARGVQFLLNRQYADGSWFVKSRALPIQPKLEIGFPHGRDQWISAAATNWATMALARAVPRPARAVTAPDAQRTARRSAR